MTAAAIDIGSNSVLLLVGALTAAGTVQEVDRALATTRLGAGLCPGGDLDADAKARTHAAVAAFVERARSVGADTVAAFATGAARRARDGRAFADSLAAAFAIDVEVLSGDAEAVLAYRAARPARAAPCLVVDVGGATTEITRGEGDSICEQVSLPLGALTLTAAFCPNGTLDRTALSAHVGAGLAPVAWLRGGVLPLIASGGTATAIAALDLGLARYDANCVHGHALTRANIEGFAAPGWKVPDTIDPRRAEILPAGACVLAAVMRAADATQLTVSDRGVGYAYLERLLRGTR